MSKFLMDFQLMGNSSTFVTMYKYNLGSSVQQMWDKYLVCNYFGKKKLKHVFVLAALLSVLSSCSSPRYLGRTSIPSDFLNHPAIFDTHAGIAIYDLQSKNYLYEYNSGKFFVPASNTKIATLYAGLKYVGDAVPGIQYFDYNDTLFLKATGDPTFLIRDFTPQLVLEFLQDTKKNLAFIESEWNTEALGYGWPWNFYLDYYMPERSPFPVYGNGIQWAQREMAGLNDEVRISYILSNPRHPWPVEIKDGDNELLIVSRPVNENNYIIYPGLDGARELFVPFHTNGLSSAVELLRDTLHREIDLLPDSHIIPGNFQTIYSRPADSLFQPMMYNSDNFFAEQTLLMASREMFGVMDEKKLIEHIIEYDFSGIPQKPRWVDGSGLSRYNLFSPLSIVWLLEKIANEYGLDRIKSLLPTGNAGTLSGLYTGETGKIYAKTGTLGGNVVSLSGFIITEKNRTLVFSVLINNHFKDSGDVRRAIESFLKEIIYRY
ncbi:MAG: D-alanyl-D-alanine carboxypeptidase [Bacteroidales bacterium]